MNFRLVNRTSFLLLALLIVTAGCGSDGGPSAPGVEPEVVNAVDNFQFQTSALSNYTGTLIYTWSNTGVMAVVDQSCSISGGAAMLRLLDEAGQEVYGRDLSLGGSNESQAGQTGDWTIRVELTRVSGTLNFRADKATP